MGKKLEISIMLFLPPATKIIKLSGFQVLVLLNLVGDLSGLLNALGLRGMKQFGQVLSGTRVVFPKPPILNPKCRVETLKLVAGPVSFKRCNPLPIRNIQIPRPPEIEYSHCGISQ